MPCPTAHSILPFVLPGFVIDEVQTEETALLIGARAVTTTRPCPDCGQFSIRIHSRYWRVVRDLPVTTQAVRLRLHVRRFFCDAPECSRRTFAERLPDLAPPHAQRTVRLTRSLADIGFATGGEAGARLATRLRLPTSGDTLLRILRATPPPPAPDPRIIGIDDFALRKGRVYGTLIVDLETHRPIDLLDDRTAATAASWLRRRPTLTVIARDRAQDYARGAAAGAPQAVQVADRFHLLVNLREAVARYVQRVRSALRQALADDEPGVPVPLPLTDRPAQPRYGRPPHLHRLQEARHAEREQRYQEVKRLHALGLSSRQVARRCGLSARTVREWAHTETLAPDRRGYHAVTSKIDPFVPYLRQRLADGCTNQSRLWREVSTQGFTGTRELVAKWIRAQDGDQAAGRKVPVPVLPSTRQLTWLILGKDEGLADDEAAVWQRLQQHEGVGQIRELARQFAALVRERRLDRLDPWLDACRTGSIEEMATFAVALTRDDNAVRAALTLPWSNGPVEGHIHKVKLIKRSAYGRMKPDLLRQRVLHAA